MSINSNEQTDKKLEIFVGYFFIIALFIFSALIIFVLMRTQWSFFKINYTVYYEYGNDIKNGTLVTLNGINIGEVKSVDIDEKNRVKVIISVSAKYKNKIRKDSVAKIVRPLLIGSKQISISPGSPDTIILKPGSTILSEESSELIDLVSGLSLQSFIDKLGLFATKLDTTEDTLQKISVREIYDQAVSSLLILNEFQKSLKNMSDVMSNLGGGMGNLSEGMTSMGDGFSNLGNSMSKMNEGMNGITFGFNKMNKNLENFDPLTDRLVNLLDEMEILIHALELNPMFKNEIDKIKKEKKILPQKNNRTK